MKKLLISLIILVAAEAFVVLVQLNTHMPVRVPQGGTPSPVSATTTVAGTFACLPHKGPGPSTMECAFGMKADSGAYYALDWSGTSVSAFDLPMDRPYTVTGLFVPAEMLNSNHWQAYDIRGIIKVDTYKELASGIPSYPASSTVTAELKKPLKVGNTTIRVWAVTEDSRCPSDVTCIWAGRVKAALSLETPSGTSKMMEIVPGQTVTTETLAITLDKVAPYPISTHKITDEEYRFTFTIKNK
ncbi:MAG: hypothetical protein JWO00_229 [Candidatus Parcubacteria bacterium]|nr:hypothetical protein [Candidatus Parcubacteria bacterium]